MGAVYVIAFDSMFAFVIKVKGITGIEFRTAMKQGGDPWQTR